VRPLHYDPAFPECRVAPALLALAEDWELYPDETETLCMAWTTGRVCDGYGLDEPDPGGRHFHTVPVDRCRECGEAVIPDAAGRLAHLLTSHGYRMDGRRFDNHNVEVGRV
jgi:hypothetical protein